MQRWEYLTITVSRFAWSDSAGREGELPLEGEASGLLDELGEQGRDLAGVQAYGSYSGYFRLFLKRPRERATCPRTVVGWPAAYQLRCGAATSAPTLPARTTPRSVRAESSATSARPESARSMRWPNARGTHRLASCEIVSRTGARLGSRAKYTDCGGGPHDHQG